MAQNIAVCVILILALTYAGYRIWKALARTAKNAPGCVGCEGCPLARKYNCSEKKNTDDQNKNIKKIWQKETKPLPLHSQLRNGTLADRLGNGLQNRVEQFDSARYLSNEASSTLLEASFVIKQKDEDLKQNDTTIRAAILALHQSGMPAAVIAQTMKITESEIEEILKAGL